MPKEFGERPPYQEPTSQRETHQEADNAANNRLPSLLQGEESWSERSHEQMVDIIKSSMEQYRLDRDPESRWFDPADWMRDQLCFAMAKNSVEVDVIDDPHVKLLLAWEIISLLLISGLNGSGITSKGISAIKHESSDVPSR